MFVTIVERLLIFICL